ncbi:endonuclease/exonuclease/phosphatase family protein [Actinocorallia longicatena]|uniref:Endonuclease/exonuclease/phosphatase domain-containing protein n=1 Tax=Actinocorallia longicatena TaxID=111803 RepID=A0ABP6QEG4_9ACTN
MRLLTLNVLMRGERRARLRVLGGLLDAYDVVCLQELVFRADIGLVGGGFAHRVAEGRGLVRGGLVVLSRWPVGGGGFRGYAVGRPVRGEWLMRKGVQRVEVRAPFGDVTVVNTHLTANRDGDWSAGNRYSGVQRGELARLGEVVAGIGGRVVVAGDFNVPRESSELAAFAAAAGVTDLLEGRTEPTFRPTAKWPSPPALDQVYTRGLKGRARLVMRDEVRLARGRTAYLSDHFGIAAELQPP